jgi:uncharacterized protein (DUF305 family)
MLARIPRSVTLVVLAAIAAGCSSGDEQSADTARVVQLGGPGETNRVLTPEEVAELDAPEHTDADVAFVQGMIHHHQQALTMIGMIEGRSERDDLPLMAERMDVSQRDELVQLETWLEQRGEEIPADHEHHGPAEMMPGMLTEDELAHLEGSSGRAFDELFLQYMIRHHEGAVAMVEALLASETGGQEPGVFQVAQHVESDQQIEISRMKQLLADIAAGR